MLASARSLLIRARPQVVGPRLFSAVGTDGIVFRQPTVEDARGMFDIVQRGTLDTNSPYAYMIFTKHFGKTCAVAALDGKVVGFIKGYSPPERPESLFVWQVGVDAAARGRGLASRMLQYLSARVSDDGVRFVEATVTPTNEPSQRLFRGFARDVGVPCQESASYFKAEDFPVTPGAPAHEAEDYYTIGPFSADAVLQRLRAKHSLQSHTPRADSPRSGATAQLHHARALHSRAGSRRSFHSTSRRDLIVRSAEDVEAAGRVHRAATGTWESRRYLLREDGMGFSFHHTILFEKKSTLIWYKNHVEAVMIVAGEGEVEVVEPGQKEGEGVVHKLKPFTMYALNGHERHYLRATKGDMHVVCAFNPPVAGSEDHNDDGVYPAVNDEGHAKFDLTAHDLNELIKPPAVMTQRLTKREEPAK